MGVNRDARCLTLVASLAFSAGCQDLQPDARTAGSARSEADPALLRAGSPRLILGGWTGDAHTDFYDVAGVVVDRRAGILVVANRGDATIRTFGLDGEWRDTRGGTGGGPEEFGALTSLFEYRGDSLLVFDDRRDEASVWPYSDGDVRRVALPSLPEDGPRYPRLHGAVADGRLVWAGGKPYREPDEVGASHADTTVVFLTSPDGTGFAPVSETLGMRYFRYAVSIHQQGRAPFSPEAFVLSTDSVVLFGWTERARAERVLADGTLLKPIVLSLPSVAVDPAHREWEIAERRRRLTSRPLPAPLVEGQRAVLGSLPFPDSFPVLGAVVAGDDGRLWVRGYRPPEPDSTRVEHPPTVWSVYADPGSRRRDIAFPARFDLLWADGEEAVGVLRDAFDVEQVVVVPLPAAARGGREP